MDLDFLKVMSLLFLEKTRVDNMEHKREPNENSRIAHYSHHNEQFAERVLSKRRLDTNKEKTSTLKNRKKEIC